MELRINKTFANDLRVWGNFSMTHARNKVLVKDDQALRPGYQKAAGHAVNQYTSYIDAGLFRVMTNCLALQLMMPMILKN